MRIHTDILTHADIVSAVRAAGIETAPNVRTVRLSVEGVKHHRSRSRARAFAVKLHGSSSRQTQDGAGPAASYDEWGIFLAALFAIDPEAIAGPYDGAEFFHWTTANRFHSMTARDLRDLDNSQCRGGHRWGGAHSNINGAYRVVECRRGCGAHLRTLASGHTFADLAL